MHALQVTPSKYDLLLKPDLKTFTFDGEVRIQVVVSEQTKTVSLHAKEVIRLCIRSWAIEACIKITALRFVQLLCLVALLLLSTAVAHQGRNLHVK